MVRAVWLEAERNTALSLASSPLNSNSSSDASLFTLFPPVQIRAVLASLLAEPRLLAEGLHDP